MICPFEIYHKHWNHAYWGLSKEGKLSILLLLQNVNNTPKLCFLSGTKIHVVYIHLALRVCLQSSAFLATCHSANLIPINALGILGKKADPRDIFFSTV